MPGVSYRRASVSEPPAAFLPLQPVTRDPRGRAGPGTEGASWWPHFYPVLREDPTLKRIFTTRGRSSGSGQGPGISGPVLPEEANCAKGQEAGGVRVGELTFPRDSKQQDFLTWDYYLSHITWPDLLPAIMNSVSITKKFV